MIQSKSKDEELIHSLSHSLAQNTRNSIQGGIQYLFDRPQIWSQRFIPGLSSRVFKTFREFVLHETPWGLAWRIDVAKAFLLPELPEIWKAMEGEIKESNPHGIKNNGKDIIYNITKQGTGRDYSIAVLKRDAPKIAKQVINGKISAAEGMRLAGKREKTVTIKATVPGFAKAINKTLSEEQKEELKQIF